MVRVWKFPMVRQFSVCARFATRPDDDELFDLVKEAFESGHVRDRQRLGRRQAFRVDDFSVIAEFHGNADAWEDEWLTADLFEALPADVTELQIGKNRFVTLRWPRVES